MPRFRAFHTAHIHPALLIALWALGTGATVAFFMNILVSQLDNSIRQYKVWEQRHSIFFCLWWLVYTGCACFSQKFPDMQKLSRQWTGGSKYCFNDINTGSGEDWRNEFHFPWSVEFFAFNWSGEHEAGRRHDGQSFQVRHPVWGHETSQIPSMGCAATKWVNTLAVSQTSVFFVLF